MRALRQVKQTLNYTMTMSSWLCIFTLVFWSFFPWIRATAAQNNNAYFFEICTPAGVRYLDVDLASTVSEKTPLINLESIASDHCPLCSLRLSATLAEPPHRSCFPPRKPTAQFSFVSAHGELLQAIYLTPINPRAPPHLS